VKRYLPLIIVVTVASLALLGGILLYRASRIPVPAGSKDYVARVSDGVEAIHARGTADATVTLEEFADFECLACARLATTLDQLARDYHERVRITFYHFPLPGHRHAQEAAIVAEAAALQGRFWEMHDLLYREQGNWSKAADVQLLFENYAKRLGLSLERFNKDMEGERTKARVVSDQQQAARLGVTSTPTVFINNEAVTPSALNEPGLRKLLDAATALKTPR
jgi:protein-disulfide isomerase